MRLKKQKKKSQWRVEESQSHSGRFPARELNLYLADDYSRRSLENHIIFPHLLKDSKGVKRKGEGNH